MDPAAYPGDVEAVELLETHISFLFLTGGHVYKVKKPVDLGFLDFTTLAKRRKFCDVEVSLNNRLAPGVYQGVVPISVEGGRYVVEGGGQPVEYAVKMRRLPAERSLESLLRTGKVTEKDVRRLAQKIATFHSGASTNSEITQLGGFDAVRQNVLENFRQLKAFVGASITSEDFEELEDYSLAFLGAKRASFARRATTGRIRDCHGDLRSPHFFLEDGPEGPKSQVSVIDRIEFNERFRYSDVANDIAFLAMDLDVLGHPEFSRLFVREYVEASGDNGAKEFIDFFKIYRAIVRGKVLSLQSDAGRLPSVRREDLLREARGYFELARSYLPRFPQPGLIMICGLTGSGKSTLANELARRWGLDYISSDVTRKTLAGVGLNERQKGPYEAGIYSKDFTRETYISMMDQAEKSLAEGRAAILDATFRHAGERSMAARLAERYKTVLWIVELVLREPVAKTRLAGRWMLEDSVSDGEWVVYQHQKSDWDPITDRAPNRYIKIDNSGPSSTSQQRLVRWLYSGLINGIPDNQ